MEKTTNIAGRATEYALDVVSGEILAGPYVRGACRRHLNDYAKNQADPAYPFYYDALGGEKAIRFFEEHLRLNGGQYEGLPFLLLPWQAFIIGSLFGWKRKADHMRRFRVAYVETPKGSGKSPLAAGIGLKGMVADGEPRAEIYAAATFKDQAMVLFRDACAFYDQSTELQKMLTVSGVGDKRWKLSFPKKNSFFKVISSEKKGQSGPRPHIALLDEIHEHTDGTVIEMVRAGFKFRRQPLSFMITNSGHDKTTVCWEYHEMGVKVACELLQDDEFFAFICSLDDEDMVDDRYLTDETLWAKVNPSLAYGLPGYDYIRGQITEARGIPSKMSTVKSLCFCIWTEAENPWISYEVWNACKDEDFDDRLLKGRRCRGGLDLSSVQDLTAYVLVFDPVEADPFYRIKAFFWLPGDNLRRKSETDHVPYDVWKKNGYLFAYPGASINKSSVIKFINETAQQYDLVGIAHDRDRIKDLMEFADKAGIDLSIGKWDKNKRIWNFESSYGIKMLPFGQTARSMAPALDKFEGLMVDKKIRHDGHPILTWNAANAVAKEDEDGYRKISKQKSIGRVDGLVALVMACGVMEETVKNPRYEIYFT